MKDYDDIVHITRDWVSGWLIGYMEELDGIARNRYLKPAIHRGDCPDLKFRHAELYVFDGLTFLIDNPTLDSDTLLCKDAEGK